MNSFDFSVKACEESVLHLGKTPLKIKMGSAAYKEFWLMAGVMPSFYFLFTSSIGQCPVDVVENNKMASDGVEVVWDYFFKDTYFPTFYNYNNQIFNSFAYSSAANLYGLPVPPSTGWTVSPNGQVIYSTPPSMTSSKSYWDEYQEEKEIKPKTCWHVWKEYVGFTKKYEYCIHCDEKKEEQ